MINNVTLVGRLTKTPELRYTGNGIAVAQVTLAIERPFTNQNGVRQTDFIQIVSWRKQAESLSNFTVKGSLVGVTGRIQTRNYKNSEDKTITDKRRQQNNQNSMDENSSTNNYPPANKYKNKTHGNNEPQNNNKDPFEANNDVIDISDDDLPF